MVKITAETGLKKCSTSSEKVISGGICDLRLLDFRLEMDDF